MMLGQCAFPGRRTPELGLPCRQETQQNEKLMRALPLVPLRAALSVSRLCALHSDGVLLDLVKGRDGLRIRLVGALRDDQG